MRERQWYTHLSLLVQLTWKSVFVLSKPDEDTSLEPNRKPQRCSFCGLSQVIKPPGTHLSLCLEIVYTSQELVQQVTLAAKSNT